MLRGTVATSTIMSATPEMTSRSSSSSSSSNNNHNNYHNNNNNNNSGSVGVGSGGVGRGNSGIIASSSTSTSTTISYLSGISSSTKNSAVKVRLAVPHGGDGGGFTSPRARAPQYMSRLTDVSQMDIQAALDQMRSLLSGRPHVVYKTAYYRKQTKNHWARDDPAFCVLQATFLVLASIAYSVAFRVTIMGGMGFILYSLVWNWLVPGAFVASVARELANRHLSGTQSLTHVKQTVEWLYAFDIHCNAFFPLFCLLYVGQFFLLPLVLGQSLVALVLSNTLYAVAFSWYWYITHLGYRSLPFLSNTEVFLFPIAAVILVFCLNLIGYPFGMGWNASRLLAQIYFY